MTSHLVVSKQRGRRRSRTLPAPRSITWVEDLPSPPPRRSYHSGRSPSPQPTVIPRILIMDISIRGRNSPFLSQCDHPTQPDAHSGQPHHPPLDDWSPPSHIFGVIAGALVCVGSLASLVAATHVLVRARNRNSVIWCAMSALGLFFGLYAILCLYCGRDKICPEMLVRYLRCHGRPARAKKLGVGDVERLVRRE